jgi:hypothetical protein
VNANGNPNERQNKQMKCSLMDLIVKNGLLATFLSFNGPQMLELDALLQVDSCEIEIPKTCSTTMNAICGFLRPGVDFRGVYSSTEPFWNGVLYKRGWNVGIPLTDEQIERIFSSYSGDKTPFTTSSNKESLWDVGARMMSETNGVCFIKKNQDNIWIGNCNDCYLHLGYNCKGCLIMIEKSNYFSPSLEQLRKSIANS